MLRRMLFLECDGAAFTCTAQFPMSRAGIVAPVDGAIETPAMLRAEAKQCGWQRYGGRDYCPVCEKDNRHRGLRSADDDAPTKGGKR